MRVHLLLLPLLFACDYSGPPCEDIEFADVAVDASVSPPVFSWSGDKPNFLEVYPGDVAAEATADFGEPGASVWGVSCDCKANIENPGANIGCKDQVDWEYRACIESPTTYGTLGAAENILEDTPPAELTTGELYTLFVGSVCSGEKKQDDALNGGDPYHVNESAATAVFTAP